MRKKTKVVGRTLKFGSPAPCSCDFCRNPNTCTCWWCTTNRCCGGSFTNRFESSTCCRNPSIFCTWWYTSILFGATSIETPAPVAPPRAAGVFFPPATVVFGDTTATGAAEGYLKKFIGRFLCGWVKRSTH